LIEQVGVAPVPGFSFFHDPASGRRYVRFAFPKRDETFAEVRRRLAAVRPRGAATAAAGAPPDGGRRSSTGDASPLAGTYGRLVPTRGDGGSEA
jgi:hypothetical protein